MISRKELAMKAMVIGSMVVLLSAPALAIPLQAVSVVEVFPGTDEEPNAQYIELGIWQSGTYTVNGSSVRVYDAAGTTEIATFTFTAAATHNDAGDTILLATPEAEDLFGVTADLPMTAAIALASGRLCFSSSTCFSWGTATGNGTPFAGPLALGTPIVLDVSGGTAAGALDGDDETGDSAADFVAGTTPTPRNNGGVTGVENVCGDGDERTAEECDDGNNDDGDGCSATCTVEEAACKDDCDDPSKSDEGGCAAAPGALGLTRAVAGHRRARSFTAQAERRLTSAFLDRSSPGGVCR
jgi:cysteine-rich repeat protein